MYPETFEAIEVDLEDEYSIKEACGRVIESHTRVDMLLNVAGVLGDGANTPGPERSLRSIDANWLKKSLNVWLLTAIAASYDNIALFKLNRTGQLHRTYAHHATPGSSSPNP